MPFSRNAASNHAQGRIYIALGANQAYRGAGPLENLNHAMGFLGAAGVSAIACSRPWRTPAWPDPTDPPFVNACAEVQTDLGPEALMALLHETESRFGRVRGRRNAPRTLDLDLIDYRGLVQTPAGEGGLALPHPRAASRVFVLLPLRDIAPNWRDPASGASLQKLIAATPQADRGACRPAGGVFCAAPQHLKRPRA
ncbi:MAG: 2-amino-4-hydroxy-6-hydroxymethyldihydropteridine diphosphokinase [Oceanicaulis sp.]